MHWRRYAYEDVFSHRVANHGLTRVNPSARLDACFPHQRVCVCVPLAAAVTPCNFQGVPPRTLTHVDSLGLKENSKLCVGCASPGSD